MLLIATYLVKCCFISAWSTAFVTSVFLLWIVLMVHGQVTIIFIVSVCLSVCLFVCAEFFSAVFDPISIKLGYMLYVWV